MSRRHLIARSVALAALASIGMSMYALPAHAVEFPKLPSATTESVCKDEGFQVLAGWKTHLANDAQSSGAVHFKVNIDAYQPYEYDLQPGEVYDVVYGVYDGLPSHITISADGSVLVDKTATRRCQEPVGAITFSCAQPGATPTLSYAIENKLPVPIAFTEHRADGSAPSQDLANIYPYDSTYNGTETLKEDAHYNVSITAEGKTLAAKSGVADCKAAPTTTTTTTVAHTVIAAQPDPVAPTTVASPATLPRTGSSSTPLAGFGFLLLCAGGGTLLVLRRRPAAV
jgi:LPXTG-motif cell wall-anchored protein